MNTLGKYENIVTIDKFSRTPEVSIRIPKSYVPLLLAAPDLLSACKAMLKADSETRYSAREFVEAKELIAAAVAKAEGRA